MKINDKLIKKGIAQLSGMSNTITPSIKVTTKLNLINPIICGKGLVYENGGIKIGKGISKVSVQCMVYFSAGSNNTTCGNNVYIYKNDTIVARAILSSIYTYNTVTIPEKLIEVNEEDVLNVRIQLQEHQRTIAKDNSSTYFLVKVIE